MADRGPSDQGRRRRRRPPAGPRPAHRRGVGGARCGSVMGRGSVSCPPGHPGPDRRRGPLGRDRGRGPSARRAGHRPPGRRPRGVHRAGEGPPGRSPRPIRPYARSVHLHRGRHPLRPRHRRHGRGAATALGLRPDRAGRVPSRRDRPGVVRRHRVAPVAPPFARRAPPRAGAGPARRAGRLPPAVAAPRQQQSARNRRTGPRHRAVAGRSRPGVGAGEADPAGPGHGLHPRAARRADDHRRGRLGRRRAPSRARTAGCRSTWPTTHPCSSHPRTRWSSARCTNPS